MTLQVPGTALALAGAAASTLPGPPSASQVAVLVALALAVGYVWLVEGRQRWFALVDDRFVRGVPWGTLVVALLVTAVYLFVQHGLWHWDEPLVLPFVSWSYFYPSGTLLAGVSHASPEHFVGNLSAGVALGVVVEYAWGHYPGGSRSADAEADTAGGSRVESEPEPVAGDAARSDGARADGAARTNEASQSDDAPRTDGAGQPGAARSGDEHPAATGDGSGPLASPWIRALVVFPVVLLASALLTSALAAGPSIGFSGTVFALAGAAVVTYPVASVVSLVAASAMGVIVRALSEPVVRETVEASPPAPPTWAGIAIQAHALGFLFGVLVGLWLLHSRGRRPRATHVFAATFLFGAVQGLWLVVVEEAQDVFLLYRGVGVAVLLVGTVLVTLAASGLVNDDSGDADATRIPFPRAFRIGAVVLLVLLTALLALPGPFVGTLVVDGPGGGQPATGGEVPGDRALTVGDYSATYAENATDQRRFPWSLPGEELFEREYGGVVVRSDDRELWAVAVRQDVLRHERNETVVLGGLGWRQSVEAERVGWHVPGAGSAYAVDLTADGERVRAFDSEPVRADVRVGGLELGVEPRAEAFHVVAWEDGERAASVPVPAPGEDAALGDLRVETVGGDENATLVVTDGDVRAVLAEREPVGPDVDAVDERADDEPLDDGAGSAPVDSSVAVHASSPPRRA